MKRRKGMHRPHTSGAGYHAQMGENWKITALWLTQGSWQLQCRCRRRCTRSSMGTGPRMQQTARPKDKKGQDVRQLFMKYVQGDGTEPLTLRLPRWFVKMPGFACMFSSPDLFGTATGILAAPPCDGSFGGSMGSIWMCMPFPGCGWAIPSSTCGDTAYGCATGWYTPPFCIGSLNEWGKLETNLRHNSLEGVVVIEKPICRSRGPGSLFQSGPKQKGLRKYHRPPGFLGGGPTDTGPHREFSRGGPKRHRTTPGLETGFLLFKKNWWKQLSSLPVYTGSAIYWGHVFQTAKKWMTTCTT
jgi:hypothetical protein